MSMPTHSSDGELSWPHFNTSPAQTLNTLLKKNKKKMEKKSPPRDGEGGRRIKSRGSQQECFYAAVLPDP